MLATKDRVVLHNVHPKTWIVGGVCFFLLALAPWGIPARLVLVICAVLLLIGAGQVRRLSFFLLALIPVMAMAFVVQAVSGRGENVLWQWSPVGWLDFAVSADGIRLGTLMALQVLCFGLGGALVSLTTTSAQLRYAFHSWKLPPRLIYLLVASLNAPTQLGKYVAIVQESIAARGLPQEVFGQRVRVMVRALATVFTLVLLEHEDRARSLSFRGMEKAETRVFLHEFSDSLAQRVVRWMLPPLAITLMIFAYGGAL